MKYVQGMTSKKSTYMLRPHSFFLFETKGRSFAVNFK
uniref:Uncharacterized protein n=1 Tax=Arundo donax TaxID=35708 RepID=A0A0A9FBI5_ARUDO